MMLLSLVLLGLISHGSCQLRAGQKDPQRGTFLGHFETLEHEVGGAVWALDEEWLRVEDFTYDGRGPDAFLWVGTEGEQPSPQGFLVPFPSNGNGSGSREMVLPAFHGSDVLFRLPDKLKVSDLRWISVWCRRFTVNFGSLLVPKNVELPMKRKISELSRLAHGVRSGNVTLLDAKTLYIPNLHYDGTAPDAYFWVGKGKPDRTGHKIPNEKQSTAVLGHYDGVDIELVLPDNLTLYDIDYLSIWCVSYRHNFGHVMIPPASELYLPPALGQTQEGSELQPIGSDKRNQYDIVDQVPDTESANTEIATETGIEATGASGTESANTEIATETGIEATGATGTEAKTKIKTRATKTETNTEIDAMTDTEAKTNAEAKTDAEAETETETEATKTKTMSVTEVSFTESASKVTKTETETTKSESGRFSDDETSENEVKMRRTPFKLPDNNDDNKLPSNPNFSYLETNSSTSFASNYSEIPPEHLSSLASPNLTVNEHIFKYDQDPEIHTVALNKLNHITEGLFRNDKNQFSSAVGDDDSVQHAVDSFSSGEEFDAHGLVKIDIHKHFGAYFFAKPNGTTEEEANQTSTSHEQGEGVEGHEAQEELEDLIHPYRQHPKDIHSVKAAVNHELDYSHDARKDHNRTDNDDTSFRDKLHSNASSESVSVAGGFYNSLLSVIGDSILMWKT